MVLPPHYLLDIEFPIVLLNNTVYKIENTPVKQNRDSIETDFFVFNNLKLPIAKCDTLSIYQELYKANFSAEIRDLKQQVLAHSRQVLENPDVAREQIKTQLLTEVVSRMLPALREDATYSFIPDTNLAALVTNVGDISGANSHQSAGNIQQNVNSFEQLLQQYNNRLFFGPRIFTLTPDSETRQSGQDLININGLQYKTEFRELKRVFVEKLNAALEQQFKEEAILENRSENTLTVAIDDQRTRLREILQREKYEESGVGFNLGRRNDNTHSLYLYKHTGPFGLKSPNNHKYYYFENVQIGVKILHSRGRFSVDHPKIMNNVLTIYTTRYNTGPGKYASFCMGNYNYDQLNRMPLYRRAVKLIIDCQAKIFNVNSTSGQDSRFTDENFREYGTTRAWLRQNNVPIMNENLVR